MKKFTFLYFLLVSQFVFSQTDYSNSWEDFYSYNNVKDFIIVDDVIYALADNAVFIYDLTTQETKKLSSVQGLSGRTTSALFYNKTFKRLVIGYENGLIEIVDDDGSISISADIVNFNQSGEKRITHISEFGNKLYVSTPFAIIEYDIEKLTFGDTFFIGNNSSAIRINQTAFLNDRIYAATENGVFNADVTANNLIDFNNWQQNFNGNFSQIIPFNDQLFVSKDADLYQIIGATLNPIKNFGENIISLKSETNNLTVALNSSVISFNSNLNLKDIYTPAGNSTFNYTLNTAFSNNSELFLGTKEFGILTAVISEIPNFKEIHPDGPLSNEVFSIAAKENDLWVVYGGYDGTFANFGRRIGYSKFDGEKWLNTKFGTDFPVTDLVNVTFDPNNKDKVYISSFGFTSDPNSLSTGGLLVVEDNEPTIFYNQKNSSLEDGLATNPTFVTLKIEGTVFDSQGNLWVTNIGVDKKLKKLSPSDQWTGYDLSSIESNKAALGMYEIDLDRSNSLWVGTRANGVYVFNENGNRKKALGTNITQGALPDLKVFTIKVDANNRVWIGTQSGLVVYNNASNVFDATNVDAAPVIILDDGIPKRLLGDQSVNTIAIDGADNKWFGTDNGGVTYTNPSGQNTLANFSTKNSPLPSNKILKISVDNSNGKVFFATDKGIVAYNSKVSPFGENLGEVYAYPNPVLKNHETVTIAGRKGTNLPKGTNVKILDVAGNLVYESNVVEGQEVQGGKVVWNKTNLRGNKVASGIYIVLLITEDGEETSMTKIAIVN